MRAPFVPALRRRALAGLWLLLGALAGCRVTRATLGVGVGFGADVQVSGLLHTGALIWAPLELGNYYGRPFGIATVQATLGVLHLVRLMEPHGSHAHTCFGLAPWLDLGPGERGRWWHTWAVEVGLALGLVKVHFGFDPTELSAWPQGDRE